MSLKKIIWFIVKLPFKVLKAVFIILGAIGGASAGLIFWLKTTTHGI